MEMQLEQVQSEISFPLAVPIFHDASKELENQGSRYCYTLHCESKVLLA